MADFCLPRSQASAGFIVLLTWTLLHPRLAYPSYISMIRSRLGGIHLRIQVVHLLAWPQPRAYELIFSLKRDISSKVKASSLTRCGGVYYLLVTKGASGCSFSTLCSQDIGWRPHRPCIHPFASVDRPFDIRREVVDSLAHSRPFKVRIVTVW